MKMNIRRVKVSVLCAVAAFAVFGAARTAAQTECVWTNGLGGNWSEAANWLDGNVATGDTSRAWFTNVLTADFTVNVDASPWTLNRLIFDNTNGFGFTVANGTLNLDGPTPTVTVTSNSVATMATALSGSDLTKDGLGTLVLSGLNAYTGATTVAGGTLVNGGTAQYCTLPIAGAAVFYRFDSAGSLGLDASGNGNTLVTASGSPAYSANGKFGGALYLNGSSTLTTTAFPTALPTGSTPYTIALWEKDNSSTNTGGFVGWGTASSNNAANNFRLEATGLKNYWYNNDLVVSGLNVKDGGWHHIAVTWDGYTQKMFVDGTNVASAVRTGLNVGTTSFVVGRTLNDASFKGWIDDLLIANRALSQDEVRSVMGIVSAIPSNTTLTVAKNATLDLRGTGISVQNLSGAITGIVDTTAANCAPILTVNETADSVFEGMIKNTAGTLSLVKRGAGTLSLSSRYNTYAGNTTIWEGTLRLAETVGWSGTIVGPTVVMTNGMLRWGNRDNIRDSATITLRGGTADLQGQHEFFGGLTLSDKALVTGTSSGWFILNGTNPGDLKTDGAGDAGTIGAKLALTSQYGNNLNNRTQTINVVTGTRLTISAPIVNTVEGTNYVGTVRKTGGGTLVLSGTNSYSGGTTVSEGVIVVSNSAALGTGPVNLAGGALNIATGTWAMANAMNAVSNATINTDGTLTLFGAITNSGNLVKTGAGTLVLGGSNSYSGATIVNEGTLQLSRMPSGIAALWHFNNSGNVGLDSSTNGNNLLTASGTPVYSTNSVFGGSLYLDGSSTLTNATFPKGIPTGSTPYTIALWQKDNGSPANGGFVGWGTPTSGGKANNLRFNGSNALLNYWYGNDLNVSGLSVKDGNWHHVAVTWDGYNQTMFVDGAVVTNTTRTGLNVGTTSFLVGKTLNDVAFKGWLDDLLIASRALGQTEIQSAMGNGYMDANVRPLPTNTTVTIASGATLDLNGNSQTVASLQGSGSVTGGVLTLTASLVPGGTNAIGTLTVSGDFALGSNAAIDWNFGDGNAADLVQVNGTLTLPAVANVAISRVTGSSAPLPKQAVILSCSGSIAGTDLGGWKVTSESGVWRMRVSGNQVIAIRQTGTLIKIQ
jgi:autotransporter-associated beta strand protein